MKKTIYLLTGVLLLFSCKKETSQTNSNSTTINTSKIVSLECLTATHNGTLTVTTAASGVTSVISYTGGNGGSHNGQIVTSTGVTGLTATLQPGYFANGNGSLTYTITGTPSTNGTASFAINIEGKTCTINRNVLLPVGSLSTLECLTATHNGTLTATTAASGVTSVISYTGGNGLKHNGQVVASTGVTGLTATLQAGSFANGNGNLTYTITGTPFARGTASFALNIGGIMCDFTRIVAQPTSGYGSNITDVEGNTYKTVYIGTQQWMAENLKTSKYNDGSSIPNFTDNTLWKNNTTGAWSYYNNDAMNNIKFGKLYNWYAAIGSEMNGYKNICPAGWHTPSDAEWKKLTDYLGGESVAGGKMKEIGTTNWVSPNTGSTNKSLFSGIPSGYRDFAGNYGNIGYYSYWWSSWEDGSYSAWRRNLSFNDEAVSRTINDKGYGFSIRCLKD